MQVQATGDMTSHLNATLRAGAMFAGGTYACYRGKYYGSDAAKRKPGPPMDPPIGQCKGCNASNECWTVGCSNTVKELTGRPPCCAYCCPANFTEQFYADRPEAYLEHPPTFLVQHRDIDENADACAALNYHNTMVAHGGRSEIHMIEPDEARCFCIGQGSDSAAAGAPDLGRCPAFLPGLAPPREHGANFVVAGIAVGVKVI
jgi:hypothetical protein